jgi:hypothetical protein
MFCFGLEEVSNLEHHLMFKLKHTINFLDESVSSLNKKFILLEIWLMFIMICQWLENITKLFQINYLRLLKQIQHN